MNVQPRSILGRASCPCRWLVAVLLVAWVASEEGIALRAEERGPQRLSDSHMLSGSVVRWAFRDSIRLPRTWTVDIFHEDRKVALGVIVDAGGWILTKGSELKLPLVCRLPNGRRLDATYVSYHEPTDLALLKVNADGLAVVEWAAGDDPQLGQWLITPGTGRRPVAVGVVSVPRRIVPRQHYRGVLGVEFEGSVEDPVIRRIFPGSGAATAGLQPGDRILKVDNRAVVVRKEVTDEIATRRPGDVVVLQIRRGNNLLTVPATLTHPFGEFLSRIAEQNQMGGQLSFRRDDFPAVIQHDTVLDPSDCGGSVVTLNGKAIGINIARAGRTETYALPADQIIPLLDKMKTGELPPPLVVQQQQLSPQQTPPPPPLAEPAD